MTHFSPLLFLLSRLYFISLFNQKHPQFCMAFGEWKFLKFFRIDPGRTLGGVIDSLTSCVAPLESKRCNSGSSSFFSIQKCEQDELQEKEIDDYPLNWWSQLNVKSNMNNNIFWVHLLNFYRKYNNNKTVCMQIFILLFLSALYDFFLLLLDRSIN